MCAEKQHKYTVVLVRKDGVYLPRVIHIKAYCSENADVIAETKACREGVGYVTVAVFHGHLDSIQG